MELTEAIAVFDKSAERTRPNQQTEAWKVIRAALTAAGAAPEGFVLVPREASDEMLAAWDKLPPLCMDDFVAQQTAIATSKDQDEALKTIHYRLLRRRYARMLAATPNPGAQHGQEGRDHG